MPILKINDMNNGSAEIDNGAEKNIIEAIKLNNELITPSEKGEINLFTIPDEDILNLFPNNGEVL